MKNAKSFVSKMYKFLFIVPDARFDLAPCVQRNLINTTTKPLNLIDRSYKQYKMQMYLIGWKKHLILNIISFFLLAPSIFTLLFIGLISKRKHHHSVQYLPIILGPTSKNKVPKEIDVLPNKIYYNSFSSIGQYLKFGDAKFIISLIISHPISPFYILRIMLKVSAYRVLFDKHRPKEIVVNHEFSFDSSVMTLYCQMNGIKHINFMHGEKLFYIRDSFFYFDEIYVWDQHYANLFESLMASCQHYKYFLPDEFYISNRTNEFDYIYYLAAESKTEIEKIVITMQQLKSKGKKVLLRAHPIWTNMNNLLYYSRIYGVEVEAETISIQDSIGSTKGVIGLFTTVLFQASLNDITCIIDDISNEDKFNSLRDMDYIMFSKDHILLSDLVFNDR
mgnify:CR=1 FL=1